MRLGFAYELIIVNKSAGGLNYYGFARPFTGGGMITDYINLPNDYCRLILSLSSAMPIGMAKAIPSVETPLIF